MSDVDTVDLAAQSPELEQPYADLGLKDDEYARIREVLGRRPTESELAMYSVMWSEHCSYKSSKVHLRQFGDLPGGDRVLAGIGANAGVVDVGDGLAVTFKVESHNHPSYVEPYQGAATGVGGIIRDILAMGARPVAVMDPLRFGDPYGPNAADVARVVRGIVAGVGGYGNCIGLPNVGGEVVFDPSYDGNPLVNALCLGVLPVARLQTAHATGAGNRVVLFGAKTGRDGIGGVSVLASATFEDDGGPAKRPSVQVGDPFEEKIVTECCLELYDAGLVVGIQDLGGAGFTCAISETAAAARAGMRVQLDRVPLREPSMQPWEVLVSESQERMLAIVTPENLDAALAVCAKWGVLATDVAEVTDDGRLVVEWHGAVIVNAPPASLADEGPVYERPFARPLAQDALQADGPEALARPATGDELRATVLRMAASPNLCSKRWVTEQYDRYVLGNTVLAQPEDAGVVRLSDTSVRGVALSTDGNGRFARLDPYTGAQLAVAEAYRNVATVGAEPYAVTDCLNFGSPEDPGVMWQFAEAVRGIVDACRALGLPVTGGNVSFYNSTGANPINPTPVVGVLGIVDDVTRRVPHGFAEAGLDVLLLGQTADELGGSEWAWTTHKHLGGLPPKVDLAAEKALASVLVEGARAGVLLAAHDLSDGGLAQALVECSLRRGVGATITLPGGLEEFVWLFSESAARAVVAVAPSDAERIAELCAAHDLRCTKIGTTGGDALVVDGAFTIPLTELADAWEGTLPRLFGNIHEQWTPTA